ncbi:DUF3971 domain-containing protein [Rickettsiales bacterium]|nr:DUF3971 domain-containing protein [Rickettsiales bacterium]
MQSKFFENFGLKTVGDIYLSFNKFSKNFELHFENIETDNSSIPNLLLGVSFKDILIFDFKPSTLKIYDANIFVDFPVTDEKFELAEITTKIIENLSKNNNFINEGNYKVIEVNNSRIELNSNIFSKKIVLFPVDFKINRGKGNNSVSGVIKKFNEKRFASIKIVESEKNIDIESNFDNFQIESPFLSSSVFYFTRNIFNITGENKMTLDKDLNILKLSSNLNFTATLNNETIGDSISIEGGRILIRKNENDNLTSFSSQFKSKETSYSINYTTDLKNQNNKSLSLFIDQTSFEDIKKLWPRNYKKSALNWVDENTEGEISNLDFQLSFPDEKMNIKFDFSNGIVKYSENMPRVFDVSGNAVFTNENLFFEFNQGYSDGLEIEKGNFKIIDLDKPVETAILKLEIDSNTQEIINYLQLAPINFDKFLRLKKISEKPKFNLELSFPLLLDLEIQEIEYKAKLIFNNSKIKDFYKNYDLESLFLNIDVDSKDVAYYGTALLETMPLSFQGKESLNKDSIEDIHVDLELEPSFLNNFFKKLITNDIGIIPISLNIENNNSNGETNISGNGNLDKFYGDIDMLGLSHNYDKGVFKFMMNLNGGISNSSKFTLHSNSAEIELDYFEKNKIKELIIKKIKSPNQDFSGSIVSKNDISKIDIVGNKLNLYHFLENYNQINQGSSSDFHFSINVDNFYLLETPIFSPVLEGKFEKNKFEKLLFKFTNNNYIHEIIIDYKDGKKIFNLESNDASFFLDVFNLNPNLKKGYFSILGTEENGSFNGNVVLNDFVAYDTPFLAKILTFFSIDGLEQKIKGGGIFFNSLSSRYKSYDNKILLENGLIRGSDLGLTFNGDLDVITKDFYVEGTLIPAYTLNTLLTKLPIVGDIITSGSPEEGVLAATFNIEHKNNKTDIDFNPISVLVPSIIRNFLDF